MPDKLLAKESANRFSRYLPLFDHQRAGLLDIYHPAATFSFSVNTAIPARARVEGLNHSKEMPNQRKLEWMPWIAGGRGGSRNLSRMGGGVDKMVDALKIGPEAIVKTMSELPSTIHDLTDVNKFVMEAWPTSVGPDPQLLLAVHGQFKERKPLIDSAFLTPEN